MNWSAPPVVLMKVLIKCQTVIEEHLCSHTEYVYLIHFHCSCLELFMKLQAYTHTHTCTYTEININAAN